MTVSAARTEHVPARHPPIGDVRDLVTFRIATLAAAVDRLGQKWLGSEFGLTIMEWRVLATVAALQPVRFRDIAKALLVDKGQLSRLVKSLAARGFVSSETDAEDQRTVKLRMTAKGNETHTRALARAYERNQRVVSALEPEELDTLLALLDKLQPFMTQRADATGEDSASE